MQRSLLVKKLLHLANLQARAAKRDELFFYLFLFCFISLDIRLELLHLYQVITPLL